MFRRSTPTNKKKKQKNLRSIDFASLWDILGSVFWEFGAGIGASEISEVKWSVRREARAVGLSKSRTPLI